MCTVSNVVSNTASRGGAVLVCWWVGVLVCWYAGRTVDRADVVEEMPQLRLCGVHGCHDSTAYRTIRVYSTRSFLVRELPVFVCAMADCMYAAHDSHHC